MNYGQQSISYLAPKIWNLVPEDIKESATVTLFKAKIKRWVPDMCPCRLCQIYIPNLGFIWNLSTCLSFFLFIFCCIYSIVRLLYSIFKMLCFYVGFN